MPQSNDSTTESSEPKIDDMASAPQLSGAKHKKVSLRARLQKRGVKKNEAKKTKGALAPESALSSLDELAAYATDAPAIAAPPSLTPDGIQLEGASPKLPVPAESPREAEAPEQESTMMFSAGTSIAPSFASELIGRFSPSSSKPPSQERGMDSLRAAGAVTPAEDKYDA